MNRTRKVYHPYNLVATVNYDEFPKENLVSLGAPGLFDERLSRKVHVSTIEEEADAIYIAKPDGKEIKERSAVVLENLSKKLDNTKGNIMGHYVKHTHFQTNLPVFPVVASKYNDVTPDKCYPIDPRIYMNPFLLNLDDEYNRKKLNNVKNKLKTSNKLSVETGMDLCNAILYAPPNHELEVLYEATDYYLKFEIDDPRLRFVLFTSFYCMADAYIDDENEFEELIEMIKEKQTPKGLKEVSTLIYTKNKLALARKIIAEKDDELTAKNNEITAKDNEITEKNNEITAKDNVITANNNMISEIKKLVDENSDTELATKINKILFKNVAN